MSLEHSPISTPENSGYGKLHSTDEACSILGIGKTSLYKFMTKGRIKAIKIGKLTKIPDTSIQEFIKNAPSYAEV